MSDPIPTAVPKSKLNRWLAVGLILSVALNVGFLGFGAVRAYKYREAAERKTWQIEEQIARRLPDNAARAFRHAFEDGRKGGGMVSHYQMRRDLAAALGAEPYDHNRLAAVLAEHRQRLDQLQSGMQAGLLAAADAMTPEQRKEFAERLSRRGPGPGGPGGPGGPPHMRGDAPPPPRN
ncbi:MAG: periplasmic heavy metal sensor [Ferrovibrio sp.]